jgi:hypothetical protein
MLGRWFVRKGLAKRQKEYALVSFPKCGRTWLRLLIGRSFQVGFQMHGINPFELHEFGKHHLGIPLVKVFHDDRPLWKTPEELKSSKTVFKDKRVIFLVRDPRDVVVSGYFERKKRVHIYSDKPRYEGTLSSYLHEPVGSIDTIIRYYKIWDKNRHIPEAFLLLRYEDMHENTERELRRVLDFLGLSNMSDQVIQEAVRYASFENMHDMEKQDALETFRLRPGALEDRESFKTRKGKVGGYMEYLSPEEILYLNEKLSKDLNKLYGYG